MAARAGSTFLSSHPLDRFPATLTDGVVALGNFDGVHRGHLALLQSAIADARRRDVPAVVLTFEPHPRNLFHPDAPVFRLTPLPAKERLLSVIGVDGIVVIPFDRAFSSLTANAFVEEILLDRLKARAVTIGYDFHFGQGRAGSPEFLAAAGEKRDFPVSVIGPISDEAGKPYSATRVREALEQGDIAAANRMLGYRWFVLGTVIAGDRRGRELGYPTANIRMAPDFRLRHGIYAVRVNLAGRVYGGVASYGRRPTFDNGAPLLEVYVFDFAGDLYGKELVTTFLEWIRPEERFASVTELVARMDADAVAARSILAAAGAGNALDHALSA
jgi:riboflavin kinase / FMN adenylyltransferase